MFIIISIISDLLKFYLGFDENVGFFSFYLFVCFFYMYLFYRLFNGIFLFYLKVNVDYEVVFYTLNVILGGEIDLILETVLE